MRRRSLRECLHKSLRIIHMILNVFGVVIIIYSLWLRKIWNSGVALLPPPSQLALPQPWFIFTCLGMGITVCLSTLCGYMVSNCINNSTLCVYIVSLSSVLLLQGIIIVAIFFKMDLKSQINSYIDESHENFRKFVIFHLYMCRLISITVLVAQINVVIMATSLRAVGTETLDNGGDILDIITDFRHSFLISPYSPVNDEGSTNTSKFEFLCGVSPIETYFSCQRNNSEA